MPTRRSGAVSEIDLLAEISEKLDRVVGLLAIQGKSVDDQIKTLRAMGFPSTFIGPVVGRHPGAVRHAKGVPRKKVVKQS